MDGKGSQIGNYTGRTEGGRPEKVQVWRGAAEAGDSPREPPGWLVAWGRKKGLTLRRCLQYILYREKEQK